MQSRKKVVVIPLVSLAGQIKHLPEYENLLGAHGGTCRHIFFCLAALHIQNHRWLWFHGLFLDEVAINLRDPRNQICAVGQDLISFRRHKLFVVRHFDPLCLGTNDANLLRLSFPQRKQIPHCLRWTVHSPLRKETFNGWWVQSSLFWEIGRLFDCVNWFVSMQVLLRVNSNIQRYVLSHPNVCCVRNPPYLKISHNY